MVRHFIDVSDLSETEALGLLDAAEALKRRSAPGMRRPLLAGGTLGLVFDKPSLRTRVSFEAAISQLGGAAIFFRGKDVGLGVRETVADFARVISQYVDMLAIRTFSQHVIEELARHATIPVINALSDSAHPCQAMGDMLTVREEFGDPAGRRLVFVGDGNNVARSLAQACAVLGLEFTLAAPPGYAFPDEFDRRLNERYPGFACAVEPDPARAVAGCDIVYTDVWASMGQEAEAEVRAKAFESFRVDAALLKRAAPHAIFLHCLPAKRGEEATSEVLDGPQSRVIRQAGNRLHFQKALLLWLAGVSPTP